MIPDAHNPSKKHRPMMTTADLSLRFDPIYEPTCLPKRADLIVLGGAAAIGRI